MTMSNLLEEIAIAFETEAACWGWRHNKGLDFDNYEVFRSDGEEDPVIYARVSTRKQAEHEMLSYRRIAAARAALSIAAADINRRAKQ